MVADQRGRGGGRPEGEGLVLGEAGKGGEGRLMEEVLVSCGEPLPHLHTHTL